MEANPPPARSVPKKVAAPPKPAEVKPGIVQSDWQSPPPVRRESLPPLARDQVPASSDTSENEVEPYVLEEIQNDVEPYIPEVIPPPRKWPHRRVLLLLPVLVAVPLLSLCLMGLLVRLLVPDPTAGLYGKVEITNGKDALSKAQVKENFKALARAQGYVWNGVDRRLPGVYRTQDVYAAIGRMPAAASTAWGSEDLNAPIQAKWKSECTDGTIVILITEAPGSKAENDLNLLEIVQETNERLKPGIGWDDKRRSLISRDQLYAPD